MNDSTKQPNVDEAANAPAHLQEDSSSNTNSPATSADSNADGAVASKRKDLLPFLMDADPRDIERRFASDAAKIIEESSMDGFTLLSIMDPHTSISAAHLNKIYRALNEHPEGKGILLVIHSLGGSIEPAYQISKICHSRAHACGKRFVVAVPRMAKSAATLIALGADQIHLGPLGQLGPIDPQISGLPALGVSQALKSIASAAAEHPKSAEMFALYLNKVLTVEQIGFCERIPESASQYASRLLSNKTEVKEQADSIANKLVREYKDHGFVIDFEEAQSVLGQEWVKTNTDESKLAEDMYDLFDRYDGFLNLFRSMRIRSSGGLTYGDTFVWDSR